MLLKDSINNLNEEGKSLLHLNAKDGNAEFVQKLIEDGADIEMKDRKHGSTPLLYACQNGHINIVKYLSKFTENPNLDFILAISHFFSSPGFYTSHFLFSSSYFQVS